MSIYQKKEILNLYHTPLNQGKLPSYDKKLKGANISCGDEIEYYIKFDSKKRIKKIGWIGRGCVISQVSASIVSEMAKGKTVEEMQKIEKKIILEKFGKELSINRIKCALLALYAFKD